jgi:hypothetical protein
MILFKKKVLIDSLGPVLFFRESHHHDEGFLEKKRYTTYPYVR